MAGKCSSSHRCVLSWLLTVLKTDEVKTYIDWAVGQGFGVIDVNIPKHLTDIEEDFAHADNEPKEERSKEALMLATYLWENYIELGDASHIFILGVGAAYTAIIELLKANERITARIDKLFFFIADQDLRSCRSATDDNLSLWYYDTSMVFTAQNHHIWDINQRKPKKRFGTLIHSPHEDLQQMLAYHKEEIIEKMLVATDGWEDPSDDLAHLKPGNGVVGMGDLESEDELTTTDRTHNVLGSPVRLPPMGNFALSPTSRNTATPRRG